MHVFVFRRVAECISHKMFKPLAEPSSKGSNLLNYLLLSTTYIISMDHIVTNDIFNPNSVTYKKWLNIIEVKTSTFILKPKHSSV